MTTTAIVYLLDLRDSIGTMTDCLRDVAIEGALGDYLYAWKNGQQILIGSRQQEGALFEESLVRTTSFVFMSKDQGRQQRRPTTWNELRALLADGWIEGTDKKPGIKGWYPRTGRAIRRQMQDIYVFRKPTTTESGDVINVGDVVDSIAAIGAGASVTVTINRIVQGLGELPTRHDASIRNFLDYYIGSTDAPEPFGGREPDLAAYTRWLDDPASPPYALLTAPAGRGKSAVLAHWILRMEPRQDVAVVFVPISERFQTNSESVVFSALYARLAHLHGERPARAFSAAEYRGVFQDYLTRPLPDGRRLLVVLDGLDEAAGWEAQTGLFPTHAPTHLKVLVAAREVAGELDWATRLGWRILEDAQAFGLSTLSRDDLFEILQRMGDPLAGLQTNFDLLDKLYELTDRGDPLMIRLYVEALRKDRDKVPDLKPEDIQELEPGLGSFFALWFQQQGHLWRADGSHVNPEALDTLINARAMALGPLTADDLVRLAPEVFTGSLGVQRVADAFRRFLVGTGTRGSGYSFSHPRLTQYFRGQLSNRERDMWQGRYLNYGAETLAALKDGALNPEDASNYVVRHYRLHLQGQAGSPAPLYALMCKGWLQAWQELEDSEVGFLSDVHAAMERAARDGPGWLGQIIRGALCFSSVYSLGSQISSELIKTAITRHALNRKVGLSLARRKLDPHDRCNTLLEISVCFNPMEQGGILAEALAAACGIGEGWGRRSQALRAVAVRLPGDAHDLLAEALAAARRMRDEGERAQALSDMAKRLPDEEARAVLAEALATAREISHDATRAQALSAVAAGLPGEEARAVLAEALAVARGISYAAARAEALSAVAAGLPGDARDLLTEALAVARGLGDELSRAQVLTDVAARLPGDAHDLLAEALAAARTIGHDETRAKALSAVTARMPGDAHDLLAEALAMARGIKTNWVRAQALSVMAARFPRVAHDLLAEALTAAREIEAEKMRAQALSAVAARLPGDARDLLDEALALARGLEPDKVRAEVLRTVAERLPGEEARAVLVEALAAALGIGDVEKRAHVLSAVAERLPGEEAEAVLAEALAAARGIYDEKERAEVLSAVAVQLPGEEAQAVLAEALAAARGIKNESSRAQVLSAVAERLPGRDARAVLAEALAAARGIGDEESRVYRV